MDFNIRKFTSDAAAAFSRAVQFTGEKLGKAEKTELDAYFESLLQRADVTEDQTKNILNCIENYLQPNPTVRMEEFFYEKLDLKKEQRMNNAELLGVALTNAGNEFGPGTPYGSALLKVGTVQKNIGVAERDFISAAAVNVLTPLKRFIEGDMKTISKERKVLTNKRLDLDACKSRLKKAKSVQSQTAMKKGAGYELVEQAEADMRVAQSEFDKQCEILKLLLEGVQAAHTNHLKCLRDFVEEQLAFYAQCHQYAADLQHALSGIVNTGDSSVPLYPALQDENLEKSKNLLDS
ncbi:Endophilin-B1 [Trichinella nativa]|uniref:Endophilin-B1 n=5 Tax=Trichinella TaxID=6333 RepID=A0A0V1LC98_9BILA|nr:Endophilin-B1 [Trichinella murrelli]KRX83904.1 Endophilin-B1 [Trichinella sp. T6]KRY13096.1 Endophilin-B1 [Trichinella patagoniensis]KRY49260.1 Endophilin-B1 [Trichinella britovi]KRZ56866.1 Endophilin-B1 [Trichinella nativa]